VKIGVQISFALGLGAVIALVAIEGAGAIASLLVGAGWKLVLLVPLQTLPLLLDVLGGVRSFWGGSVFRRSF